MKRDAQSIDYEALVRVCVYLDATLKKGVVVGMENDKVTIDDRQILDALNAVRDAIDGLVHDLDRLARVIARTAPGSLSLQ
jgi:hypothetical protein